MQHFNHSPLDGEPGQQLFSRVEIWRLKEDVVLTYNFRFNLRFEWILYFIWTIWTSNIIKVFFNNCVNVSIKFSCNLSKVSVSAISISIQQGVIEDNVSFDGINSVSLSTIGRVLQCNRLSLKQVWNPERVKDLRYQNVQVWPTHTALMLPVQFSDCYCRQLVAISTFIVL